MDEIDQCPKKQGLYDPNFEKGSCGVGFIADINGKKTYDTVKNGLQILKNMSHRGATGADPDTGDGAGIMIQVPHEYYKSDLEKDNVVLPEPGEYGVGMIFFPMEPNARYFCEGICERIVEEEGQTVLAWRDVPVNDKACGVSAQGTRPIVEQLFIQNNESNEEEFNKKLYMIRKRIEAAIIDSTCKNKEMFFVCSL